MLHEPQKTHVFALELALARTGSCFRESGYLPNAIRELARSSGLRR
jgi:hypothetical protein